MERPVYQMNKQTTEQFLASLDPKLIEEAIKMRRVNKCDIKKLKYFCQCSRQHQIQQYLEVHWQHILSKLIVRIIFLQAEKILILGQEKEAPMRYLRI